MHRLLVITGPSGVGKTYLASQLLQLHPNHFEQISLFTTRQPRTNETFQDRIYISEAQFRDKEKAGDFFISEQFNNNWYGYDKSKLQPTNKHLIVNAWPWIIPRFVDFKYAVLTGLTIDLAHLSLLKERMHKRGDSEETINSRIGLIKRDLADLETVKGLVNEHGHIFTIDNDSTIPDVVIPWLEKELGL